MKRVWIAFLIAGIAIVAVSAFHYFTRPGAGDIAPRFELTSLEGKAVGLEGFPGRPVVLHFWASWCAPCRWELPLLSKAAQEFEPDGLVVLAVSEDDAQSRDVMQAFVRELAPPFLVLLDGEGRVADAYESWSVPETFFIDGAGTIRWRHAGPVDWTAPKAHEMIRTWIAEGR